MFNFFIWYIYWECLNRGKMRPIKNFLTSFFWVMFDFDEMICTLGILASKYLILYVCSVFLILSNVKIPSLLARVKMRRAGLFSKNGDSTRIFWSFWELWNSVSFLDISFTFVYIQRRLVLKDLLRARISSALSSNFQRTAILFAVRYNFTRLVDWRNFQRRFFENALENGEKDCGVWLKC